MAIFLGAVQYLLVDVGRIQATAGKDFDTSNPQVTLRYLISFPAAGMLAPASIRRTRLEAQSATRFARP